jgi:hypothetical protein
MSDTESDKEEETWWAEIDGSGKYMVAGGGMYNGNAYANIEEDNGNWWYVEYGKNPSRRYLGNKFVWVEKRKGCPNEGSFRIEMDLDNVSMDKLALIKSISVIEANTDISNELLREYEKLNELTAMCLEQSKSMFASSDEEEEEHE